MFPYKMHGQPVELLSGGEKRRLYLLTVLIKNPNFLILDEPTNDLDVLTLQKLEDFLQLYKGCLLIVSHDRCFLDSTVDQLFVFQGNGEVKGFMGNYSQYHQWIEERNKELAQIELSSKSKTVTRTVERKRKKTFKEQKEYESLTIELAELENEKKDITAKLETVTDYAEIEKLGRRMLEIDALVDEKELRWLELDEI